jgi:hypothetical protein
VLQEYLDQHELWGFQQESCVQEIQRTETETNGIKYLILTKGDVTIVPGAFSTFIEEQTEGLNSQRS